MNSRQILGNKPSQPGKPGLYEKALTLTPSCLLLGFAGFSLYLVVLFGSNKQKFSLLQAIIDAFLAFSEDLKIQIFPGVCPQTPLVCPRLRIHISPPLENPLRGPCGGR